MKVAISGATGLIGTALSESLAADGIQIVALSRKPGISQGPRSRPSPGTWRTAASMRARLEESTP